MAVALRRLAATVATASCLAPPEARAGHEPAAAGPVARSGIGDTGALRGDVVAGARLALPGDSRGQTAVARATGATATKWTRDHARGRPLRQHGARRHGAGGPQRDALRRRRSDRRRLHRS